MKRIGFSIVMAFAMTAMSFQSCSSGKKDAEKKTVVAENVRITTLEPKDIGRVLEFSANTEAWEEVNLVPVSPGRIEKIYVEVGSRVRAGQTLVQMDQTNLRQAQLNIDNQKNDFKRYETLHVEGEF